MTNIINLTDAAIARIKKLLQQQNSNSVFRIAVKESGCSGKKYVVEVAAQPEAHDEKITAADVAVYIDHDSIKYLQGCQLDCVEKGLGMWQWIFDNPKAKANCGCGESFAPDEKVDK